MTLFYTCYAVTVFVLALRSGQRWIATAFIALGVASWTLVEYLFHRYILHGRFAHGQGAVRHFLHTRLDPLHWEHNARPDDGQAAAGSENHCRSSSLSIIV